MHQRIGIRHALVLLAGLLGLPLLVLGVGTAPASAANVSNVTFRVPADVEINPCFPGDIVNLSGTVHVVTNATADGSGGYHMTQNSDSRLKGASITTRTGYVSSQNKNDTWYAGTPFPQVEQHTYDWTLVSQSGTPNYILHMTMHTTVTANGTALPVVDSWRMDCTG
jgi:hypothetical protein